MTDVVRTILLAAFVGSALGGFAFIGWIGRLQRQRLEERWSTRLGEALGSAGFVLDEAGQPGTRWVRESATGTIVATRIPTSPEQARVQAEPSIRLVGHPASTIPTSSSKLNMLAEDVRNSSLIASLVDVRISSHEVVLELRTASAVTEATAWLNSTLPCLGDSRHLAVRLKQVALNPRCSLLTRTVAAAHAAQALTDVSELIGLAQTPEMPAVDRALLLAAFEGTSEGLVTFATMPLMERAPFTHALLERQASLQPLAVELLAARGPIADEDLQILLNAENRYVVEAAVAEAETRNFSEVRHMLLGAMRPGRPQASARIAALALSAGDEAFVDATVALLEAGECSEAYLRVIERWGSADCVPALVAAIERLDGNRTLRARAETTLQAVQARLGPVRVGALSLASEVDNVGSLSLAEETEAVATHRKGARA